MQNKNYVNAEQVLPSQLLEQVQRYAAGKLLYVPQTQEMARPWGEGTGQRSYYRKRNQMIRNKHAYGEGIPQLAREYCLSPETVKKIVYNRKAQEHLPFYPHAASAERYSRAGLLEEWIHTYLLFERRNKEFSDGLYRCPRQYIGPLAMPLSLFTRSSGPEEHMKWRVHPVVWEERVAALRAKYPALRLVGTTAHREQPVYRQPLSGPVVIMLGNETLGLSHRYKEMADVMCSIPMAQTSSASSLNVGCAASILLYEAVRQRSMGQSFYGEKEVWK